MTVAGEKKSIQYDWTFLLINYTDFFEPLGKGKKYPAVLHNFSLNNRGLQSKIIAGCVKPLGFCFFNIFTVHNVLLRNNTF